MNIEEAYLNQLSEIERKAYNIAKEQLGSSFSLQRSVGFNEFKNKYEKELKESPQKELKETTTTEPLPTPLPKVKKVIKIKRKKNV